ncbi:MAG: ABC transporter ATP-binding protein, partial [Lysobacteraceae bacterium]
MSATPEYVIETRALSKRYGRKLALDNLDLRIPRGRIHAIVGANGAGKSTLFRILMGFMPPTAGEARILGKDSQSLTPRDRSRIGFVNEEHTLPNWMRVAQVTTMQKHQYTRWNQQAFDSVIGHYHVLPEQKVGQLSRGERAGFNLALALAQRPELLVLDEPTLGLDVVAKRAFLESLLYSNAADDCTVIYCSHQMEEIERVADNLIILERGQLKNMSAPEDFTARVSHWVADVPFKGPELHTVPGLLEVQRLDGLHHYLVLDQHAGFEQFLRTSGARNVQSMPVSLD